MTKLGLIEKQNIPMKKPTHPNKNSNENFFEAKISQLSKILLMHQGLLKKPIFQYQIRLNLNYFFP